MEDLNNIHTKESLLLALQSTHKNVANYFAAMPPENFFARPDDGWSPSDNLDHLVKSVQPIARAMQLPKEKLKSLFGIASRPSRSFQDIYDAYLQALHNGAQASGRFLPDQAPAPAIEPEEAKAQLLTQWVQLGPVLLAQVEAWSESDLDTYLLPHPLLENLTFREMLFFTLCHNHRHMTVEGD
jgi:hypothetical protein